MNRVDPNTPSVPVTKPQAYIVDLYSERTASPIHRVTDATHEELQDIVVFYHGKLEESKRLLESALNGVNSALGYDDL